MSREQGRVGMRVAAVIAIFAATVMAVGSVATGKPPADTPAAQGATYFARVGFDGTQAVLVQGRGVASVWRGVEPDGSFYVTFTEPVDACGWTASINPFFGGPPSGWGEIVVGLTWDNTIVPPEDQTPDPYTLRIEIVDGDGATIGFGLEADDPQPVLQTFSVVATC